MKEIFSAGNGTNSIHSDDTLISGIKISVTDANFTQIESLCLRMHNNTAFIGSEPYARLLLHSASECRRICIDMYPKCVAVMFYYLHERDRNHICYLFSKNSVDKDVALVPEKPMKNLDMIRALEIVADCHQFDPFPPLYANFTTSTDRVPKKKRDVGFRRPVEVTGPWSAWSECSPRSGRQVRSQPCEYGRNIQRRRCFCGDFSGGTIGYPCRLGAPIRGPFIDISISYPPYPYRHPIVSSDEYAKIMSQQIEYAARACCYWRDYFRQQPVITGQQIAQASLFYSRFGGVCPVHCAPVVPFPTGLPSAVTIAPLPAQVTIPTSYQPTSAPPYGPTPPSPYGPTLSPPYGPTAPSPYQPTLAPPYGPTLPPPYGPTLPPPYGSTIPPPYGPTTPSSYGPAPSPTYGPMLPPTSPPSYGSTHPPPYETTTTPSYGPTLSPPHKPSLIPPYRPIPGPPYESTPTSPYETGVPLVPERPEWSTWTEWSQCTMTCGVGNLQRYRVCLIGRCQGESVESRTCDQGSCPANWAEWSQWSTCHATCGTGKKTRSRHCNLGEGRCYGNDYEVANCATAPCPEWSQWQSWSHCSTTCGYGVRRRIRTCHGDNCIGKNYEESECQEQACARWSEWQEWSQCSVSCGHGVIVRKRVCMGNNCVGDNSEQNACWIEDCPAWNRWSAWSSCSVMCGYGISTRERSCSGTLCVGGRKEAKRCYKGPCSLWSTWQAWSSCSVTCGRGMQWRYRTCTHTNCKGNSEESQYCDTGISCGQWTVWGSWSECSRDCGVGKKLRHRECVTENGTTVDTCICNATQSAECMVQPCCEWTQWASWSPCSHSCAGGRSSRTRICLRPEYYRHQGEYASCTGQCYGDEREDQTCNEHIPCETPTQKPDLQPTYAPIYPPTPPYPTDTQQIYPEIPTAQIPPQPTQLPSWQPVQQPTLQPTWQPSLQPTRELPLQPTRQPSLEPIQQPPLQPTEQPLSQLIPSRPMYPSPYPPYPAVPTGFPSADLNITAGYPSISVNYTYFPNWTVPVTGIVAPGAIPSCITCVPYIGTAAPAPITVPGSAVTVPAAPGCVSGTMCGTIMIPAGVAPAITIEIGGFGCQWSEWYAWSACTTACAPDVRRRFRTCLGSETTDCVCYGEATQEMDCVLPINC